MATKKLTNIKKVISLANDSWEEAKSRKITSINASNLGTNYYIDQFGREFNHFCTTSYLGLEFNPKIIDGAIKGINVAKMLRIPNSRNRCKLELLSQYEDALSGLFNCNALTTLSCSASSAGILPIISSGAFTNNIPPIIVYDKFAHYSMNHIKPSCAAETEVITAPHNDMNYLEDICKENSTVAYVADGAYSMGGLTKVKDLLYLQQKYNLFLYLDDSHSLSIMGDTGQGYVKSHIDILNEKTIIVASLAKAFGASGGLVMMGSNEQRKIINRYGGPSNWSQSLNSAAIGAGLASIEIHKSNELQNLQIKLQNNIKLFDSLLSTEESGNSMPIRLIRCYENHIANEVSEYLMNNGFFTSAVFFPVVPQGRAAIRVTLRSDISESSLKDFCRLVKNKLSEYGLEA